jgi:hypothetical protein
MDTRDHVVSVTNLPCAEKARKWKREKKPFDLSFSSNTFQMTSRNSGLLPIVMALRREKKMKDPKGKLHLKSWECNSRRLYVSDVRESSSILEKFLEGPEL